MSLSLLPRVLVTGLGSFFLVVAWVGCGDDAVGPGGQGAAPQGGAPQGGASQGGMEQGGSPSGGMGQGGDSEGGGMGVGGSGGGAVDCAPGATQLCYTGPAGTENVGICTAGTRTCGDDGKFGDCLGQVLPSAETCETTQDEDCDGVKNEEGPGCVCVPGSVEPCYDGPSGTEGVGLCAAGTHTCSPTGLTFGTCVGEVTPAQETCGTAGDDDCDGLTNEEGSDCICVPGTTRACYSADPATENVGLCHGGTQTCEADGLGYGICVGEVTPSAETCNTPYDDDCDGVTNESGAGCVCPPSASVSCYSGPPGTEGVGVCTAGTALCNGEGTVLGPCLGEVLPSPETCTTLVDDDCDGLFNESGTGCVCSPGSTAPCYTGPAGTEGIGSCAEGVHTCLWHGLGFGACTGEITPTTETCATPADDDCDGTAYVCTGNHLWSRRYGDAQAQVGFGVATDGGGNVITAGAFKGTIDLGGGLLTSAGDDDIYLAKLDSNGSLLWSKRFGSTGADRAQAVTTDGAGNIIVTGLIALGTDFGGGTLSGGGIFVAKFDPDGNHLWSKRFGSSGTDRGYDVATDAFGNVLVTGNFGSTVNFGGSTLTSAGGSDIFLAKLSPTGAHVWSRSFGSTGADAAFGITTDAADAVLVTGYFSGTVGFGGTPLVSAGGDDIFVAKFNAAGVSTWSRRYGNSASRQYGFHVAIDHADGIVVTGYFQGAADFGGGVLTSAGYQDVFVLKLDSAGGHVWSKRFGTPNDDYAHGIATDSRNDIAVVGYFVGTIDFGGGPLISAGGYDTFIVKLDASGNHAWSKRFGAGSDQFGYSVTVDASDDIVMAGEFSGSVDFGGGVLTSAGSSDACLVKLAP